MKIPSWWSLAPKGLADACFHVRIVLDALFWLRLDMLEIAVWRKRDTDFRQRGEQNDNCDERRAIDEARSNAQYSLTTTIQYLSRSVSRANCALEGIEPSLGAAADDIVEHEGIFASSVHRLVVRLGAKHARVVIETLGLEAEEEDDGGCIRPAEVIAPNHDENGCTHLVGQFVAEGFLQYLEPSAGQELWLGIDMAAYRKLEAALEREVFRAWKQGPSSRNIPNNAGPDPSGDEERAAIWKKLNVKMRPAYERDHLWLKWCNEEDLGPAEIRNRWNALPLTEREQESPRMPQKIGTDERGRDTVKKALRKAASEGNLLDS